MPPHSVVEWMIGQNIAQAKNPRRDVLTVALSTDDEADTDTLSVTYPRTVRTTRVTRKNVRFEVPRRSAMKTRRPSSYVAYSSTTDDEDTKPSVKKNQAVKSLRKREEKRFSEDDTQVESDTSNDHVEPDLDPHPTCPCTPCVKGRLRLEKLGKAPKGNEKHKRDSDEEGKSNNTNASKKDAKKDQTKKGKDNNKKQKSKKEKSEETSDNDDSDTDFETESEAEPQKSKKKGKGDKGTGKQRQKGVSKGNKQGNANKKTSPQSDAGTVKEPGKTSPRTPLPPPEMRHPNLIMPVRAQVIQLEHAVEDTLQDPRPNAFMDNEHGICRVYHGPTWGNPFGFLYPRRTGPDPPPMQAGTPHPLNNPFYYGMTNDEIHRQMQQPVENFVPLQGAPAPMGMFTPAAKPRTSQMQYSPHTPTPAHQIAPPQQDGTAVGLSGMPAMTPEQIAARFSDQGSRQASQQQGGWDSNVGPSPQGNGQNGFGGQAWVDGARSQQGSGGNAGNGWAPGNNGFENNGGNFVGGFGSQNGGGQDWGGSHHNSRQTGSAKGSRHRGENWGGYNQGGNSQSGNFGNTWGNSNDNSNKNNRNSPQGGGASYWNSNSRSHHGSPPAGNGNGWDNAPQGGGSQHPSRRNSPRQSNSSQHAQSPDQRSPQNNIPGAWNSGPGSHQGGWSNNAGPAQNSPHNSRGSHQKNNGGLGGPSPSHPGPRGNSPRGSPNNTNFAGGGGGQAQWGPGSGSGSATIKWGDGQQQGNGGGNWGGGSNGQGGGDNQAWADPTAAQSTHGAVDTCW